MNFDREETQGGGAEKSDTNDAVQYDNAMSQAKKEVRHLLRRVRNVRESIQLSPGSVAMWDQHCNAAANCVAEWRSVVSFYGREGDGAAHTDAESDGDHRVTDDMLLTSSSELSRSTSIEVFSIVQMAMQSGPLAGAKPGYFKRCGSEVARQALLFLDSDPLSGNLTDNLRFSEKQVAVLGEWKNKAQKAAEKERPPSSSSQKMQILCEKPGKNKTKRLRKKERI